MVGHTSRSWLDIATIVQCQGNQFVNFRLQVTPMSQERPHNLQGRRFLQQTPGEFIARNLYPFCKLKDLPSRKTSSSEERKQHHEAIGPDKTLQRQALHDCFAVSEFLKRVVAAGPVFARGQAQYVQNPVDSRAAGGLSALLQWAQSHLGDALRVEDLARHAAMSPRTFARQFRQQTGTTPHQWLTHQRLLAAQMRLEKTDDGIDAIAEAVGLQTAATLRQHFSRTLDTTPTAYRRRFSTT
jgi:AraC-like DNA-binding protein